MQSSESGLRKEHPGSFLPGQRIIVVGVTCTGKTTLANHLAKLYQLPSYEMDSINWGPEWQAIPRDEFRQKIDAITSSSAWVLDGNYREVRDLVWARAQSLIWLDYELSLVLLRLLRRTLRRIIRDETLWNGNHETWRNAFLSKDSLFLYAISSHKRIRKGYPETLELPVYRHLKVVRLKSPAQMNRWLQTLAPDPTNNSASGILIRS